MTRAKPGESRRGRDEPDAVAPAPPVRPEPPAPRRSTVVHAVGLIVLVALFAGALSHHAETALDPLIFADDARQQVWPFLRSHDASLFPDDAIADYELAGLPAGYRLLMGGAARLVDPRTFADALAYPLLALAVTGIAVAAGGLGGRPAAYAAAAFALSSFLLLERTAGGLPRAYAFPVVAWCAAALVTGRPILLAALVPIGAAFYPMTAVIAGVSLALLLFALPARDRGRAKEWSAKRRLACAGLAAAGGFLVVIPNVLALAPYGPTIRSHDVESHPEVGPGGRYDPSDRVPFESLPAAARRYAAAAFWSGAGAPGAGGEADAVRPAWPALQRWLDARNEAGGRPRRAFAGLVVFWTALCGFIVLVRRSSPARRFALLAAAGATGYAAASVAPPLLWLPPRYAFFTVPVIALVAVPAGVAGLAGLWRTLRGEEKRWTPAGEVVVLAACAAVFVPFGGWGSPGAGLTVRIDPRVDLFRHIATLPKDALVAGWPLGAMDNVPYLSERRAFATYETHQVFHAGYLEMMNRRVGAIAAAYFEERGSGDAGRPDLLRLRDAHEVTHVLVDRRHAGEAPRYFEPIGSAAREAFLAADPARTLPGDPPREAIVYEEGPFVLLDLSRLPGAPSPPLR